MMEQLPLTFVQQLAIWILPVLFAITVHEAAHGLAAHRLGDKTAFFMGRLSLNPVKHIDLWGTIIVPGVCFFLGSFIFGWAKPVPIDWRNLKHPRRDTALVAIAGPLSNLIMAVLWGGVAKVGLMVSQNGFPTAIFIAYMGMAGITINVLVMALNLLPIPPLDGSRVVSSLLPIKAARIYDRIEPYGMFILLALLLSDVLSQILRPMISLSQMLIFSLFSL
jgi:Zn-dependent protease